MPPFSELAIRNQLDWRAVSLVRAVEEGFCTMPGHCGVGWNSTSLPSTAVIVSALSRTQGITMENEPFYLSSGFWQALAAGVAIMLSQLPPIKLWFKRARLLVETYERIALTEEVGHPAAQWHLSITNTGNRDIKVKRLILVLRREGEERSFEGRGYFVNPQDKQPTLLTPFTVRTQEMWGHNVNFFKLPSRDARQAYARHSKALREDLRAKLQAAKEGDPAVEGEPNLVQPFLDMFDAAFFWNHGEYEIELRVETDFPKANITTKYRMTLFETDAEALRERRGGFKYGYGAAWPHSEPAFQYIEVVSVPKA